MGPRFREDVVGGASELGAADAVRRRAAAARPAYAVAPAADSRSYAAA